MLVDSHCHINSAEFAGRLPEVLAAMQENHVAYALVIGISRDNSAEAVALAQAHGNLFAAVGVHPDSETAEEFSIDELVAYAQHPKVIAIGETGLDYHWCSGDLSWQHARFAAHIQAACAAGLPLVVHTREAADDTLRILKENRAQKGVIHCFTEDTAFAKRALDLGFYISFSGIVTFKNAAAIQAACRYVPDDRLLVETDSPYLAPVPKRGKTNQPAYVRHTAGFVAQLRNQSLEHIARTTTQNFFTLFDKAQRQTA